MKQRIYITVLLAFFTAFSINTIEAQTKKVEKKIVIKKKTKLADGTEVIEVEELTGEDAEKYLKKIEMDEEEITIEIESEEGEEAEEIEIEVEIDGEGDNSWVEEKEYKVKIMDDDGNVEVIMWDGEGEMPEDMKKMMEEHDIDIDLDSESPKKIIMIEQDKQVIKKEKQAYKMKFVDDEGNVQIFEWDGEGDMPEDMKKMMEKHKGEGMGLHEDKDHDVIRIVEEGNTNKAQLGVMIEDAEGGVKITDFVVGSNAEKAGLQRGDVISLFEGKPVKDIESLVSAISGKVAGDVVEVSYIRGDVEKTIPVELTPRAQAKAKKFKWKDIQKKEKKKNK